MRQDLSRSGDGGARRGACLQNTLVLQESSLGGADLFIILISFENKLSIDWCIFVEKKSKPLEICL
jgi:hypothetical protein